MKWNHNLLFPHIFGRVRLKGVHKKLNKNDIFVENRQITTVSKASYGSTSSHKEKLNRAKNKGRLSSLKLEVVLSSLESHSAVRFFPPAKVAF
jgi:hypothetical protein